MNSHWLLSGEAGDAAEAGEAGEAGDASLGIHPSSGWLAGSRHASIGSWKPLMMLSLSSSGSHLAG